MRTEFLLHRISPNPNLNPHPNPNPNPKTLTTVRTNLKTNFETERLLLLLHDYSFQLNAYSLLILLLVC